METLLWHVQFSYKFHNILCDELKSKADSFYDGKIMLVQLQIIIFKKFSIML